MVRSVPCKPGLRTCGDSFVCSGRLGLGCWRLATPLARLGIGPKDPRKLTGPGACNTPAIRVAGAASSPTSLARNASSDGSSASALTPSASSIWVPKRAAEQDELLIGLGELKRPLSPRLPGLATTARRGRSLQHGGDAVESGPVQGEHGPNGFLATLKVAPAARIFVRNSVTSATVIPLFWVTTTIDVLREHVSERGYELPLLRTGPLQLSSMTRTR